MSIQLTGEMDKLRFWQEAALRAMQSYIIAVPPNTSTGPLSAAYTKRCSEFAFDMAERMHKNHGPNVAPDFNNTRR